MRYKTLLIDADDTLFDFYAAEEHALSKTLRSVGYTAGSETYMEEFRAINERAWADYESGRATVGEIRVRRFRELLSFVGVTADSVAVSDSYVGHLAGASYLLPGAHAFLTRCSHEASLVMVTNGLSDVQHSRIDAAGIRHYFDAVIVSDEVGIQKPDPKILRLAMEQAKPPGSPNTTLMIGDGLGSDIRGAINAGVDSLWLNVRGRSPDPEIAPTYTAHSLDETLGILLRT